MPDDNPIPAHPHPPGRKSDRTRARILAAARSAFAELGYDRATVRDIARRAAADPALVIRYFGSKESLFAAASEFDVGLPDLAGAAKADIGALIVAHFLRIWEGEDAPGFAILMRAAANDEASAEKMRAIFAAQVAARLAAVTRADPAVSARREGLVATQLLGLAFCHQVLRLPPVVAMTNDEVIAAIGPAVQSYLFPDG